MAGSFWTRWALLAVVCACAFTGAEHSAAQEPLRLSARTPDNARVIQVRADEAVEFGDGRYRYYRLLGTVLIDQGGFTRVRADSAIVRIDLDRQKRDGSCILDVYAEKNVSLEHGSDRRSTSRAVVELSSTAQLDLKIAGDVKMQALTGDPFFQRARDAWTQKPTIVQTSASTPATPVQNPSGRAGAPAPPPSIYGPPPTPPPPRVIRIAPRTGKRFEMESVPNQPNTILVSGGVIMTISNVEQFGIIDFEADNIVIWAKGDSQQFFQKLQSGQSETSRESEFYMSGNVILRGKVQEEERKLTCDRLYYNVGKNIAIAISADLELRQKGLQDALHVKADELFELNADEFRAKRAEIFSSRLPSDPGLKVFIGDVTITQQRLPKSSILNLAVLDPHTGEQEQATQRYFHGTSAQILLEDIPIFYSPFVSGTTNDPTGPLRAATFSYDAILGYHIGADFDIFNLLGIDPAPGTRWTASVDEFTKRGPGIGSQYQYGTPELTDDPYRYSGLVKLYAMYDNGIDQLGAGRGGSHPDFRGRAFWRNMQDLPEGWQITSQVSYLSDRNFLEQYYKPEFDQEMNQETFLNIDKHTDIWGASLLVQPDIAHWWTETVWLPRLDGHVVGLTPFDLLTYNARASVGYAQLRPATQGPPALQPTDAADDTGRFDFWQSVSLPFNLGPFRIVPFLNMDVAEYTNDLAGQTVGRFYLGEGVRASLPFSRLYPDVYSELLNAQGIYHKAVLSATYYNAWSSLPFTKLPQLDQLNDNATDQSLRDITPLQPALNPANGVALATSPIFNPQLYAIRRLDFDNPDTLASIQELQLDLNQRWQTKRGYPGQEHTVDLFTLDLSATIFPEKNRDNFGSSVGFIEYDAVWNVGDRTSLVSNGWFDPFNVGTRFFTVGGNFGRPDGTVLGLSFSYADPIDSRLVSVSETYNFSKKYSVVAASAYDFGYNKGLSNSLTLIRNGTDLQLQFGIGYNPITNSFGVSFTVVPLLLANRPPSVITPTALGAGMAH